MSFSFKYPVTVLFVLFILGCSKDTEKEINSFTLTTSSNPAEGGTIAPSSGTYDEGTTVTLLGTPASGYAFVGWTGGVQSSQNPITVTMNSNKTITGVFEKLDSDGDGVTDDVDTCLNTPAGAQVDENGCSLSSENSMVSFQIEINGEIIDARIDQDLNVIAFEAGSFDVSNLTPSITISEGAVVIPATGEPVDFTNPVTYSVTAENGDIREYTVSINEAYNINAFTLIGPRWGDQKVYTRARLYIQTEFLNPELAGVELFLTDGVNRFDLPIIEVSPYEDYRILYYQITTEIPEATLTNPGYRIVYKLNDLEITSEISIDVVSENSPKITGVNQASYSPGDTLIITGENLTPFIGVPSYANFYLFNPDGNITTELNPEQTEYRLLLEVPSSFAYQAFFFYPGDTRDVIFIGPDQRMGAQVTVNVIR